MKPGSLLTAALVSGSLLLASCQKGSEYLHYMENRPPKTLRFTHKLKELQGESRVDILWIIDNSGSMSQHQQAVIENSDLFIQNFVKSNILNWRMGLISTSTRDEPYVGFTASRMLERGTTDPVQLFNEAVGKLGTGGDGSEKPFASIQNAVAKYPTFLRSNAILALILVTDAREQSGLPTDEFLRFLTQLKANLDRVIVYGVLGPEDFGCNPSQGGEEVWNYSGSPYETLIQVTKGKVYNLCSSQFGANLADLGKDLVTRVKSPRIRLTARPIVPSIKVLHNGESLPGGAKEEGGYWRYDFDLNALVFHDLDFAPDENEKVTVVFEEADTGQVYIQD